MTNNAHNPADSASEQTLTEHLIELRRRLLNSAIAIGVIFVSLIYFANDIYHFVAQPLLTHLPATTGMIATEVAAPFLAPFKLVLVVSAFFAMPVVLYQVWAFIAPGLYQHEKRIAVPLFFSSIFLFYAGVAFAYFLVFPLIFGFFSQVAPEGVTVMTDISHYLSFVLKLFFAFGFAFEIPIAVFLLCFSGVTTPSDLGRYRPYIIVGAFTLGMLVTPPDVFSQTFLALPMWILFELGLVLSKIAISKDSTSRRLASEEG